ncbi:hypothetical protein BgiBS90_034441 [Biomphalaria glabrata]|nr:hypothetical protein BgiBS90_034441 [Biomphalaria glabrata]
MAVSAITYYPRFLQREKNHVLCYCVKPYFWASMFTSLPRDLFRLLRIWSTIASYMLRSMLWPMSFYLPAEALAGMRSLILVFPFLKGAKTWTRKSQLSRGYQLEKVREPRALQLGHKVRL